MFPIEKKIGYSFASSTWINLIIMTEAANLESIPIRVTTKNFVKKIKRCCKVRDESYFDRHDNTTCCARNTGKKFRNIQFRKSSPIKVTIKN